MRRYRRSTGKLVALTALNGKKAAPKELIRKKSGNNGVEPEKKRR